MNNQKLAIIIVSVVSAAAAMVGVAYAIASTAADPAPITITSTSTAPATTTTTIAATTTTIKTTTTARPTTTKPRPTTTVAVVVTTVADGGRRERCLASAAAIEALYSLYSERGRVLDEYWRGVHDALRAQGADAFTVTNAQSQEQAARAELARQYDDAFAVAVAEARVRCPSAL